MTGAIRVKCILGNGATHSGHLDDGAMSLNRLVSAISLALGSVVTVSSAADSMSPDNRQSALTPALSIVQADSLNTADKSVVRVDAKVEQEFEIIHSVSAYLTPKQVATLRDTSQVIAPAVPPC